MAINEHVFLFIFAGTVSLSHREDISPSELCNILFCLLYPIFFFLPLSLQWSIAPLIFHSLSPFLSAHENLLDTSHMHFQISRLSFASKPPCCLAFSPTITSQTVFFMHVTTPPTYIFLMYMNIFPYLYLCAPCVYVRLVPKEARRVCLVLEL